MNRIICWRFFGGIIVYIHRFTLAIVPLLMIADPATAAASQNCRATAIETGKHGTMAQISCAEPAAAQAGSAADDGTGRALCLGLLACLFVAANQASRRRAAPVVLS